jgi:hypothetical protein
MHLGPCNEGSFANDSHFALLADRMGSMFSLVEVQHREIKTTMIGPPGRAVKGL